MTGVRGPAADRLREALRRALVTVGAPEGFEPEVERPRDPDHGDFATNAALVLAGRLGRRPRDLAERLREALDPEAAGVSSVEVAGPGFLNFRVADERVWRRVAGILAADEGWGRSRAPEARRINVEFVSANPTGPLHVAHGRGAALGDAVASLLEWTGHDVSREFYVNDAGRQIELLGESVEARFRQSRGEPTGVPEGGYRGEYVAGLARAIAGEHGPETLARMSPEERTALFAREASDRLRAGQERDLRDFGVRMETWRSETALYEEGRIETLLERLRERDLVYEEDGALWLRTSEHGDEKDRVLVKTDGSYTYFLPDIAYHLDKAERGFDRAIDVWGADHHGHVRRMQAALGALGHPDFLEVLILQLVTVMRAGVEARMSKREGRFVTLRDLFAEVGPDVARYFFLMRRPEVHLNFDLDLALDTSEANPVYKVKYAHARMCSVFEKGGVDPESIPADEEGTDRLDTEAERDVATALLRFPEVVRDAARSRSPHRVCAYLEELAARVNRWYHEGNLDPSLRVLAEGPARPGRLRLARAVQITLRNGLGLLGIEAPKAMLRDQPGEAGA